VWLISAIRYQSVEFLADALAERGIEDLNPSHGALLSSLFGRGGKASMKELLKSGTRKKTTLTEMANKLERQGYLRRERDPEDARSTVLVLTDKAIKIKKDFDEISISLLERTWSGFDDREKASLVALLERMLGNYLDS
jgi:DNA-binding MarR family transcriptional regulator